MAPAFFLVAWLVLPLPVWGAMLFVGRRLRRALIWISCLVSMIAGVFFLANYVWALDAQLLAEIDKHEPGTPEAERATEEWASDTDRSFLLALSPAITLIWYGIAFLSLFGLQRAVRRKFPAKNASVNSSLESEHAEQRDDAENPYQPPIVEE